MGPAFLITLGVLFLLDQMTHIYWMEFGRTWPALLIVIGLIMFLQYNAPAIGHVPREYPGYPLVQPPAPGQAPPPWRPPAASPPAPPPAAAPGPGNADQGEVHNG
jgi:hypothetical protein